MWRLQEHSGIPVIWSGNNQDETGGVPNLKRMLLVKTDFTTAKRSKNLPDYVAHEEDDLLHCLL